MKKQFVFCETGTDFSKLLISSYKSTILSSIAAISLFERKCSPFRDNFKKVGKAQMKKLYIYIYIRAIIICLLSKKRHRYNEQQFVYLNEVSQSAKEVKR